MDVIRLFRPLCVAAIVFAASISIPGAIAATETASAQRPRIGVVLSGGGARGAAHIGVLRVLEQMRIPIDCIAGTSMGSLVGGTYAAGVSLDEMEAVLGAIDWDEVFTDDPKRTDKPYRQRRDDFTSLWKLELGIKRGSVKLPYGATAGYKFELLLREMLGSVGDGRRTDFGKLPIPFRAVATDLESGTVHVFSEGDLAKAMRASMSVPGLIAPEEIDGRLFVDGGLVRNLPIDVARETCADVVIAVNLGTPLLSREELTSVLAVASQSINLLTEINVKQSLASLGPGDLLIEPDLKDFSSGDFANVTKAIPIGEAAARKRRDALAAFSIDPDTYAAYRLAASKRVPPAIPVDDIRVARTERVVPDVIQSELKVRARTGFDRKVLHEDLKRLYGRGDFERVGYSLLSDDGGHAVLIEGTEKSWGPNYVKFGLGYQSSAGGPGRFSAAASHRMTWINEMGGEWRNDLTLGYDVRLRSEYFQPVAFRWGAFVAPSVEYRKFFVPIYSGDTQLGNFVPKYARVNLDAGIQGKFGELRLGAFGGPVRTENEFGVATSVVPEFDVNQLGFAASLLFDQLDDVNFPKQGILAIARARMTSESWGSGDEYTKLEAGLQGAYSFGPHTLTPSIAWGGSPSTSLPPYDAFQLGGFGRLSGFAFDQLIGDEYRFGSLKYAYEFGRLPSVLGKGLYLGGTLEAGRIENRIDPTTAAGTIYAGSLFFGADSIFGPLYIAVGLNSASDSTVYVVLGRP
jgi:NTE family protein